MARTLKQKWASERCFYSFGSLGGIKTRLRQLAKLDSTLPAESDLLNEVAEVVDLLYSVWIDDIHKELSFLQFKQRRG